MKIFFFGSDYSPTGGGIAKYTENWLHAIAKEGVSGKATIFGNKNPRKESILNRIEIKTLKRVGFFYTGFVIFLDFIKHINYDYFYSLNLFPVGFWTVFWSKVFFKKSIITFYGADACDMRTSKKVILLQDFTIRKADLAITISESTKNKVIGKYKIKNPDNIIVIYPILPEDYHGKDIASLGKEKFTIITVCRLVKRKGVDFLIKSLTFMNKDENLLIVGDGPERANLEKLTDEYSLRNRVVFAGKVPDLSIYYKQALAGALVSYDISERGDFEGLGLVLLEAQSYGLPVIGTRSGGIPEAIEDGKTGFVVEERDPKAIANAVIKLKENTNLYKSMSERTKYFINEKFGAENTVRMLLRIINK